MPAAERRACFVATALKAFASHSYSGVTTADIASAVGVSEPILYRHFSGKRELYLACLDEAWSAVKEIWERAVAAEPDPGEWIHAMGRAYLEIEDERALVANLWVQALTEASDDPEICAFLRDHMREVHAYVCAAIERSQASGGIAADRDPSAEAWTFIALGLLTTVGRRLGGLLEDDLADIVAARRGWLRGASSPWPAPAAAGGAGSSRPF